MNKYQISKATSENSDFTQSEIYEILDPMFESILEMLQKGEEVILYKFGRFYIKVRGERNMRDPRTNTPIVCPAKKVVKFQITPKFTFNE